MKIYISRLSKQAAVLAALFSLLVTAGLVDYFYFRNKIYPGVWLHGMDMGGKTPSEARLLLEKTLNKEGFGGQKVFFYSGRYSWSFSFSELGVSVDWQGTLGEALAAGRKGFGLPDYQQRLRLLFKPVALPLVLEVAQDKFAAALSGPAQAVRVEAKDASFILSANGEKVEVVKDQPGLELDLEETKKMLVSALATYPEVGYVDLPLRQVPAKITAAHLMALRVHALISSFGTDFPENAVDRAHNIRLAAQSLDGTLIKPGEEFSFNGVVGETGPDKGYRPAPVIVAGEIVEGSGGGVCQVSTTLYNAVLLAGLKVAERANHSLAVAYVPPGRDATIAYGWRDLRFINDKDHAVWIRTFTGTSRLTICLYGDPVPGREVKILTTGLETIPKGARYIETDQLPAGVTEKTKNGQAGFRVTVWRVTYVDGKEVARELISQDSYRPVPDEFLVGTGAVAAGNNEPEPTGQENGRGEEN